MLHRLTRDDRGLAVALDRLSRLATAVTGAPMSVTSIVTSEEVIIAGSHGAGLPAKVFSRAALEESLCAGVVSTGEPLILSDAARDPDLMSHPAHTRHGVSAYLGVPLVTGDGIVLGAFCVYDRQPRAWTGQELDSVMDLAASVVTEIELRRELIEREEAHRASVRAEAHYRFLVESVPEALYVLDSTGHFQEINSSAECILGRPAPQVVGLPFQEVIAYDDRPAAESAFLAVMGGIDDNVTLELRIVRPDGEERLLAVTATAIRGLTGISGTYGIARDISAERAAERTLRESEAKFRQLAENIGEVFWMFSPAFDETVYISPAYERLTG